MSIKGRTAILLAELLRGCVTLFGERHRARAAERLGRKLPPVKSTPTRWGTLRFLCEGEVAWWRAAHVLSKEPETIAWIDGFDDAETLWDVGANVGVYALYAAQRDKIRVLAFEPAPANYETLVRNVELNGMGRRVTPLCIAFGQRTEIATLNMVGAERGGTLHQFGGSLDHVEHLGRSFPVTSRQAALGFAIDRFVELFDPPFPTRLKIDVDGHEDRVLAGARRTLADPRLRSLLLELDLERDDACRALIRELEQAGLELRHRADAPPHGDGQFSNLRNHIFFRR